MSIISTVVGDEDVDTKLDSVCRETQSMIDIAAKQLFGLRQCAATDELIQKEIWESETKLVCLFSKMLTTKAKLKSSVLLHDYPSTQQWLEIVGIKKSRIEMLNKKLTLKKMLECSETELEAELMRVKATEDEIRMLITAVGNLNKCKNSSGNMNGGWMSLGYHWSTFKQTTSSLSSSSSTSTSISNANTTNNNINNPNSSSSNFNAAPNNNSSYSPHLNNSPKFHHRHHNQQRPSTSSLPNETAQITPKFSNSAQLLNNVDTSQQALTSENHIGQIGSSHYVPASPHLNLLRHTPSPTAQMRSQNCNKYPTTPPPNRKIKLTFEPITKSKSHESQLSLKINLDNNENKKMPKRKPGNIHLIGSSEAIPPSSIFRKHSSGNSEDTIGRISGQSSPLFSSPFKSPQISKYDEIVGGGGEGSPYRNNQLGVPSSSPGGSQHKFKSKMVWGGNCDFCKKQLLRGRVCKHCKCKYHNSCVSKASSLCKFTSDDDTSRLASNESSSIVTPIVAVSNALVFQSTGSGSSGDPNTQLDHCDSIDSNDDNALHRDNSISIGLKEWNIPYNELKFNEFVGAGRFGTVHKGYWHGEVAIKELNWCTNTDDQIQLQAFKLEVTNLRKTRHENLVLFIGACMEPPKLAIITSFVNGMTLYERIRIRKEKMALNHVVIIASQIAVGLGYLHSKGIIHKDLKTKNIFVESLKNSSAVSKVVISDYGLFCVTKLCSGARKGGWLEIPNGWLSYISPEIARKLKAGNQNEVDLPFSKESDIYAFGTIWYELLTGDLPHDKQPPECVIWRVGKGEYHPTVNLQTEFKEILMKCWSLEPADRPTCQQICKSLETLPRKRLARSPSHPVQLSRSAESLF
ncbi:hypothetical protein HELRODRAFT_189079 [Helobdella robusta]|uniref:non-specific serine/threonine protein kinase n=1 Tax=Helobdella robusta TaxID=6412 RepID=T1FQM3_HELRO|nr:hypothetical protein HELRODRAFT_189079 [Helobdella robusta]ESN96031.1 hypothetical protein HELRODRAFT_189079 [Helobdella robusta]